MGKYLDDNGLTYFWSKLKDYFQAKLVSGTNIKTINGNSLLGSGNIIINEGAASGVVLFEYDTAVFSEVQTAILNHQEPILRYSIDSTHDVYLQLEQYIAGTSVTFFGSYPTALNGTANPKIIRAYINSEGTKVYNITELEQANGIKPLYEPGDSITYGEYESGLAITGFVTSSKTEDHYTIPLSKPCVASTVTITNFGLICRQDGSYVHNTGATTYRSPSYTAKLTGQDSDGAYTSIHLVCTWSNTSNVVNNAPMAANIRGVFTFA